MLHLSLTCALFLAVVTDPQRLDLVAPQSQPEVSAPLFEARLDALSLRLVGLEDQVFSTNASFSYDIELQNVSDNPVKIPWSASSLELSGNVRAATASIALFAETEQDSWQLVTSRAMFGHSSFGATMKTLAPGEVVHLRAGGNWSELGASLQQVLAASGGRVKLQARYQMRSGQTLLTTTPSATVEVTVTPSR